MRKIEKLELSKAEVTAIMDYIYQHSRANKGTAYRVWERMFAFVNREMAVRREPNVESVLPLFVVD